MKRLIYHGIMALASGVLLAAALVVWSGMTTIN